MGALDGKAYTSTFGALGFFYLGSGSRTLKRPGRVARLQIDDLPYGSARTIQKGGWSPKPIALQIVIKAEHETAWQNAIGSSATLTLLGDSPRTAVLADTGEFEQYPDNLDALTTTVTFEF
jgi:hypothetical protein